VTPVDNIQSILQYDKEKYEEMILDAAETVLGFFGFDRCVYSSSKKERKWLERGAILKRDDDVRMNCITTNICYQ
jgi:hypothetical protein